MSLPYDRSVISKSILRPFLHSTIRETNFAYLGEKYAGKVRDIYLQPKNHRRILIATDRQSAFDQLWCVIPLKGQILTQLSTWWFEHVTDVMPNHIIAIPDPNVTVVKELKMIPIEIIVRGYLTGSTGTSAWVNYAQGKRNLCGNLLPQGMVKNQPFVQPIITPTTKGKHDESIDPKEIVERGFTTEKQWNEIAEKAIALFMKGQKIAAERKLILVDTKYEMGFDEDGTLTLADEVHTPDSSRYWIADTYDQRFTHGKEPESLDKEFFRLWLRKQGFDPAKPDTKPTITDDVRLELSARYIDLFERMTGEAVVLPKKENVMQRMEKNLKGFTDL